MQPPEGVARLDDEDRRVLMHIRAHAGAWLALVERVPPADLIERVLPATAYAYELRGGRRMQAWENLKKMRGLVRRIQNRGYATLPRIADHIDSLTAGDESNAVLEALDAVNLMTVHASKGLEFPVVFVVNIARGASGPPRPVRVIVDGEGGEPSVSVGPFVSETDEAERERETQETRRLMYVAVTRARDRLYFSSVLKDGILKPGRGSLAEVLPDSLKLLFARAVTSFDECSTLAWSGQSGRPFEWRICRAPEPEPEADDVEPVQIASAVSVAPATDRFGPTDDQGARRRVPVTRWLHEEDEEDEEGEQTGAEPVRIAGVQDLMVGTLVHRLFQFAHLLPAGATEPEEIAFARGLLRAEERAGLEDIDATAEAAARAWRAMRTRPDVTAVLSSGRRLHEVPFSLATGTAGNEAVLRGSIDCLVQRDDGSVAILEFKTGTRRDSHQRQLDIYVAAASALFPKASIDSFLIYPDVTVNPDP